jgi:hypothetical protein
MNRIPEAPSFFLYRSDAQAISTAISDHVNPTQCWHSSRFFIAKISSAEKP